MRDMDTGQRAELDAWLADPTPASGDAGAWDTAGDIVRV